TLNDINRRRLSHVVRFRFKAQAKHGDTLTWQVTNKTFDLWNHVKALLFVDFDYGINDSHGRRVIAANSRQRANVFRKARAPEAGPGMKKLCPDSAIHSDSSRDLMNVAANFLAKIRNLINERNLRRKKSVCRILN